MRLKEEEKKKKHFYWCERKAEFCGGDVRTLFPGREVRGCGRRRGLVFLPVLIVWPWDSRRRRRRLNPRTPALKRWRRCVAIWIFFFCYLFCFVFFSVAHWLLYRWTHNTTHTHTDTPTQVKQQLHTWFTISSDTTFGLPEKPTTKTNKKKKSWSCLNYVANLSSTFFFPPLWLVLLNFPPSDVI